MKPQQLQRMKELIPVLTEAARAYYQESRELMSNREYDALYDELLRLERETGVVLSGSPTQKVGYETVTALPKKEHPVPMLSQNKTKSVEELQSFLGDQTGLLSWKMDGLTVVLTYEDGSLLEAVTRGDGRIGAIVTANAAAFRNIPRQIAFRGRLVLRALGEHPRVLLLLRLGGDVLGDFLDALLVAFAQMRVGVRLKWRSQNDLRGNKPHGDAEGGENGFHAVWTSLKLAMIKYECTYYNPPSDF